MPKILTEQDPILRYDEASLTDEQKAQAKANIDGYLYPSLLAAITDVNNDTRANAITDTKTAKVKVFTAEDGKLTVSLLGDTTETNGFDITKDIVLQLNGHAVQLDTLPTDETTDCINFIGACEFYGGVNPSNGKRGSVNKNVSSVVELNGLVLVNFKSPKTLCNGVDINLTVGLEKGACYAISTSSKNKHTKLQNCTVTVENTTTGENNTGAYGVCPWGGSFVVENCTFNVVSNKQAVCIQNMGATISINDTTATARGEVAVGIYNYTGSCSIQNSTVKAVSPSVRPNIEGAVAIRNSDTSDKLQATNCTFYADAKAGNFRDDALGAVSIGVRNDGDAYLYNCTVTGTHSALSQLGNAYVIGGTYKGTSHGGIYFSNPDGINWAKDAHLMDGRYDGEFTEEWETNEANDRVAFAPVYIGGGNNNSNIIAYLDGCTLNGLVRSLRLRNTSGDENNTFCLSNCTVLNNKPVSFAHNSHQVRVGVGCNITADMIRLDDGVETVEGMMTFTNELYRKVAPDEVLTGKDYDALLAYLQTLNA